MTHPSCSYAKPHYLITTYESTLLVFGGEITTESASNSEQVMLLRLQALNIHVPDWESNGSLWPHIHHRILAALLAAQITAVAYFAVKEFLFTPILLILPLLTLVFHVYCKRTWRPLIERVSLFMATEEVTVQPSTTTVVAAYTPIYLRADAARIHDQASTQ